MKKATVTPIRRSPGAAEQEVYVAADNAIMLAHLLRTMHNESREAFAVIGDALDRITVQLDALRKEAPARFAEVLIAVDIKLSTASLKLPENSIEGRRIARN